MRWLDANPPTCRGRIRRRAFLVKYIIGHIIGRFFIRGLPRGGHGHLENRDRDSPNTARINSGAETAVDESLDKVICAYVFSCIRINQ